MTHQFTYDDFLTHLARARTRDEEIVFDADSLKLCFGFKRMDGKEILMRQLFSSKSEMELQTLHPYEMQHNIKTWCNERGVRVYYDFEKDQYRFK